MNNINMLVILGLLVVILILILVIVLLMMNKKSSPKQVSKGKQRIHASFNVKLPEVYFPLPKPVEKIPAQELVLIGKKIFDAYKLFGYANKPLLELEKKEWHSWQVSILLMIYKNGDELFVPIPEEKFHKFLLTSSDNDIKSMMTSVIKKYENYVKVTKTKDELCKDVRWTVKEVSVIFYFLSNYKKY